MASDSSEITSAQLGELLERLKLENVESDGTDDKAVIGKGSYGRVIKVYVHGTLCAAKEVHPILVEQVTSRELEVTKQTFLSECVKASRILHPNVVQMLGVYYPSSQAKLPWLVMELMETSLRCFLEKYSAEKVPLHVKLSILVDTSQGLEFLHGQNIIHRDLSSNNILLTKYLVAKIADLGVAKVVEQNRMKTQTQTPGTLVFMPPEVLLVRPRYSKPVDVFSLACVALHVMSHQWPEPKDLFHEGTMIARTEVQRREEYLKFFTQPLKNLTQSCLHNQPECRPEIAAVCVLLKGSMSAVDHQESFATANQIELLDIIQQRKLENQSLQENLNNAEASLIESKRYISQLEEQLHEQQDQIKSLQKHSKQKESVVQNQRQLTEKVDELTSELTIKKGEITRLTDNNKLLSKKISKNRNVQLLTRQLTEKIDELTSELTIKKREITRLTDSNKLLSKKISGSRTVQLLTDKNDLYAKETAMDVEKAEFKSRKVDKVVEYCKTIENKRTHDDAIMIFLHEQLAMLRTLNVHGCNISDKGTELIMEILMNTTSLQSFNISNTKLNTIKAAAVIRAFTLSKATIKSLNISKNCITISCIENILSALAQCLTLEDLDISHNLLTFTGIVKIAESLRGHQNLKNLNLSNNLTSFHSEGEFFIDVILSTNQSLVYLNMCGRNIRPRFGNNHLSLPPTTELSTRFPLQNLYLSQLISFDMLTFKSNIINIPDKCIKANREKCPFDQSIVSYYVDHDGGTFYNQDHDFAIVIPPGAVLQGECVEIKATASYFGPYQFPSGYHPVSSFFWASSNYTFKIPVYLILSHYAVIRNVNDIHGLCVLQAAAYVHDYSTIMERKPMMEEVLNGVHFDFKMRYCIIATQHFCSFSVQDKSDSSLPQKFKVLCYDYKHSNDDNGEKYITDVCFCPNNCDCSKIIERQCLKNHGKMLHSSYNLFDFAKGESLHINDFPKIDGWSVDQHSVVKVPYDSFDYRKIYDNDEEKLKEAKDKCQYPPRLQILYIRKNPSVSLDYRFRVILKKEENEKSEVVAIFPLTKAAREVTGQEQRRSSDNELPDNCEDIQKDALSKLMMKEPEMFQLYKIVVPKILAHWEEVAYISFHCDISKVEAIEAKQNKDPKKCCQELVKHWMQTEKAKTWETLLKQLKEVDELTANVEEILHQLLSIK